MSLKNIIMAVAVSLALTGCISSKSYVDPKYQDLSLSDLKAVESQHLAKVEIEFQRNGEHLDKVDEILRVQVEKVFLSSGVITPSTEREDITIKVTCNNFSDLGEAFAKGFGTGLTFGLAGSTVIDFYEVKIELMRGDEHIEKTYEHALHSTIGNTDPPFANVEGGTAENGFNGIIEDVIFQFIKDMQEDERFSFRHSFFWKEIILG